MPPRNKTLPAGPEATEKTQRTGIPAKSEILDFIRTSTEAVGRREVARAFGIKGEGRIELKRILKELAADGLIGDPKRRMKPEALPAVAVVDVRGLDADGDLIAAPVHWDEAADGKAPRIRLKLDRRYTGPTIGVGDRVLARLSVVLDSDIEEVSPVQYIATPIKRLPKEKLHQLGLIERSGRGLVVQSIDKKDMKEWPVVTGDLNGAEAGELVRFEMRKLGSSERTAVHVVERIGNPRGEKAVSLIAIHNHGLRDIFPDEVILEVEALPEFSSPHGVDLTGVPLITIDPEDAKDHDDAVWAAPDTDPDNAGGCVIIVAIADVSFYIRPGSALDREALLRGNSVYFPDRVVPMLPERLSNGLCSLRQRELRPCLAVRMTFDGTGKKRGHRFLRGTMRSAAKLSYKQAQAAIDGKPDDAAGPLLDAVLKPLWAAYAILKAGRDAREPLDLDLPERKIVLDANGLVSRVETPQRLDAHRLIEEFMIQANVAAAEALEAKRSPLIYRVHDAPSTEKVASLVEFLASVGVKAPRTGFTRPSQFNRVLDRGKGTEYADLLNEVVLRSQAQAEYSAGNLGHFGLNLRKYAHFTSPIRRYADLVVHRALVSAFGLGEGGLSDAEKQRLDTTAESISKSERKAMSAERETVDRLIAMYLSERIGETFDARISGVTKFGLFVKLKDTGADGFVPAGTLGNDYYKYVEAAHALVGERGGESFRLGDTTEVKLVEANPAAGALRFQIVSDGRSGAQPAKRSHASTIRSRYGKPGKRR